MITCMAVGAALNAADIGSADATRQQYPVVCMPTGNARPYKMQPTVHLIAQPVLKQSGKQVLLAKEHPVLSGKCSCKRA